MNDRPYLMGMLCNHHSCVYFDLYNQCCELWSDEVECCPDYGMWFKLKEFYEKNHEKKG